MDAQQMAEAGIQRTEITAEAGSVPDAAAFFAPNPAPADAALVPVLSEEQMRVAGASYEVLLSCGGRSAAVTVHVVDTTPPVISCPADLTVYEGDSVAYRSGVTLSDNAEGEISLEIVNDYVNLEKEGDYPVRYVATDAAGNVAEKEITLLVVERSDLEETVDALADDVIAEIVRDDMTKWETCYALWDWCRTSIQYSYTASVPGIGVNVDLDAMYLKDPNYVPPLITSTPEPVG